jgi:hypothetical protein
VKDWVIAFSLLVFGLFLAWSGMRSIRLRLHENGRPAIEEAILRVTGVEPMPRTSLDTFLGALNHWMAVILGPVLALVGALLLANKAGFVP